MVAVYLYGSCALAKYILNQPVEYLQHGFRPPLSNSALPEGQFQGLHATCMYVHTCVCKRNFFLDMYVRGVFAATKFCAWMRICCHRKTKNSFYMGVVLFSIHGGRYALREILGSFSSWFSTQFTTHHHTSLNAHAQAPKYISFQIIFILFLLNPSLLPTPSRRRKRELKNLESTPSLKNQPAKRALANIISTTSKSV